MKVHHKTQQIGPKMLQGDSSYQSEPESIISNSQINLEMSQGGVGLTPRRSNGDSMSSIAMSDSKQVSLLTLLKKVTKSNQFATIDAIEAMKTSLKTALMMPPDEFDKNSNSSSQVMDVYQQYTAKEDLYGVFLIINKSQELFEYLWDEQGMIWSQSHLFPMLNELISKSWIKGIQSFFQADKTKTLYTSYYPQERREFYKSISSICSDLLENGSKKKLKVLDSILIML